MRPMGVDDARSFIKVILALILKAQVAITASVYGEYPRVEGAVMFRGLTLCLHLAPWMIWPVQLSQPHLAPRAPVSPHHGLSPCLL